MTYLRWTWDEFSNCNLEFLKYNKKKPSFSNNIGPKKRLIVLISILSWDQKTREVPLTCLSHKVQGKIGNFYQL